MLTKEEYKRELIRMWDSVRGDEYKGKDNCNNVSCEYCILDYFCNGADGKFEYDAFEVIEEVEKWSNEHPRKKYEVPQIVYDVLSLLAKYGYSMKTADGMTIEEYLENCEVVDKIKIKINERGTDEQTKD